VSSAGCRRVGGTVQPGQTRRSIIAGDDFVAKTSPHRPNGLWLALVGPSSHDQMSTRLSRHQAERLRRGSVAAVLLELNSAAGGRGVDAQSRVVGGEGVVAGVLQGGGSTQHAGRPPRSRCCSSDVSGLLTVRFPSLSHESIGVLRKYFLNDPMSARCSRLRCRKPAPTARHRSDERLRPYTRPMNDANDPELEFTAFGIAGSRAVTRAGSQHACGGRP